MSVGGHLYFRHELPERRLSLQVNPPFPDLSMKGADRGAIHKSGHAKRPSKLHAAALTFANR